MTAIGEVVPDRRCLKPRACFHSGWPGTQDNSSSLSYQEDSLRKVEGTRSRGEP